jgi:hypothetical protein
MTETPFDRDRVVRLLERDATGTLGERFRNDVLDTAANVEALAIGWMTPSGGDGPDSVERVQDAYDQKVVDDFQQYVHDTHAHTTWPPCPRHPNHPLEYTTETDAWCCPRDGAAIAPLGELGLSGAPAPGG